MTPQIILGLDVAQAGVVYHLQTPTGQCLARGRAAATRAGWDELTAVIKQHRHTWPECLVAVEATGQLHLPWCEAAHAAGAMILALNPLVPKRITPVSNAIRDHKSDPVDAAGVAETAARQHPALGRFRYRPDPARFGLRKLLSARGAVRAALTNLRKSAGDLQTLVFPELRALALPPARQRALLQCAPSATAVAALDAATLQQCVGKHATNVGAAAKNSFAPGVLAAAAAPALQELLRTDGDLETRLDTLNAQIARQAVTALPAEQLRLARTLPGFGEHTATVILACIPEGLIGSGRPRRQQANALQALFGCDPRLRQSGQWRGKTKMSKRGIGEARTALYQAAFCALAHDPAIKTFYDRQRARGKPHKPAIVDVMRVMLRRLVAVLNPLPNPPPCRT